MKTREQIQRAYDLLNAAALREKDPETYECVSTLASALKWALELPNGNNMDQVLLGCEAVLQDPQRG